MKNIFGARNAQNYPKNSFLHLQVGKTTSRLIYFGENRKIKILHFSNVFENIFQERPCKRLNFFLF